MDTAPRTLPRGRHGLSRETVRASQRARVLDAVAQATAEKGYAAVTISDIVRGAGVAKGVFYDLFEDKLDCYLAAYDAFAARLIEDISAAVPASETIRDRYAKGIHAFVDAVVADPAAAEAFVVEVAAAGRAAQLRRAAVLRTFAAAVVQWRAEAREHWPELEPLDELRAFGAVAALHELLLDALLHGGVERVREQEQALAATGQALMGA